MKKLCAVFMVLITLLFSVVGVVQAENNETITIAVMDKGKVSVEEGTMEENRWTKWMREETGLDLQWVAIPRNGFKNSLNNLVALGEAPDVLIEYDANFFSFLANEELIQPLDELIDKYSIEYKEYLNEHPELVKYTKFNGKTYVFTSLRGTTLSSALWIRQDWLDELSLAMPTSTDELLEVARKFKQANLGGENTVPIVLNDWQLASGFGLYQASPSSWYVNENGKVEFGPLTSRYQAAIDFLKTAYDEGLVMRDFPTDTDYILQKRLWINGSAGILMDQWSGTLNYALLSNNIEADIVPVPPIKTEFGLNCYARGSEPNLYVAINKQCKNPVGVMKFIDWMIGGGFAPLYNGFEGIHYNVVDGKRVAVDDDTLAQQLRYSQLFAIVAQEESADKNVIQKAQSDYVSQKVASLAVEAYNTLINCAYRVDMPRTPEVEEFTTLLAEWNITYDSLYIKAITSGKEYTSEMLMKDLRDAWYSNGGAKVEALVQKWYDLNKSNWSN